MKTTVDAVNVESNVEKALFVIEKKEKSVTVGKYDMTKLCLAARKKNVEINWREHILSCHDGCERMVGSNKYLHMFHVDNKKKSIFRFVVSCFYQHS